MRAQPSEDEYQVTIARHGTRQTVRSDVFLNYHLYRQPDGPIGMDYFLWVIRNRDRTIVVDTGYSRQGAQSRGREVLIDVGGLLERIGVDAAEVPTVVLTHAHYDHIGNLDVFPGARFLLNRKEFDFWSGPNGRQPLFHHSVEDDELALLDRLVDEGRVDFFEGTATPAPGVEVIEIGGHTPGQSVVKVATSEGAVLLASDAVHYYEELESDMPFSSVADLVHMYDSFRLIRGMLASGEVSHVVSGHDPSTLGRFTPGAGDLADAVSTIGTLDEDRGNRA